MKKNNSTDAEDSLVYSPLCQRITRDGTEVDIQIYNDDKGGWLLEIVDEFWNSTVWDDSFTTDSAALAEALKTIDTDGKGRSCSTSPSLRISLLTMSPCSKHCFSWSRNGRSYSSTSGSWPFPTPSIL